MDYAGVVKHLKEAVTSLSAVYIFGSQVSGHARVDSDLDVAVLADEVLTAEELWDQSSKIGRHCSV